MRMVPKAVSRTNVSSLGQRHRGYISNSTRGLMSAGQVARGSCRVLMAYDGANGMLLTWCKRFADCFCHHVGGDYEYSDAATANTSDTCRQNTPLCSP